MAYLVAAPQLSLVLVIQDQAVYPRCAAMACSFGVEIGIPKIQFIANALSPFDEHAQIFALLVDLALVVRSQRGISLR